MKPPPLNAPFEDKAIWLLKELERLNKIPKWKKIMDYVDSLPDPEPKKDDAPKSKEITDIGKFHEEVATKEINKYLKMYQCS